MSIQDSPDKWVATHRIHHKFTEQEGDPHSTRPGFWWAQIGWIVWGTAQDHDRKVLQKYVPDLLKDKGHALISRFYYVPIIISAFILFAIGGWTMVVWGVFARVVVGWHTTWFVNSLHNNHHAFPTSARHGLEWYQFDMNWIAIRILKKLGLAQNIRVAELDRPAELKRAA
jgi:stearoyl-CoA desaturase (delta-9 desaturase)